MPPKKSSRGKTRKPGRRPPASVGWLQALWTVLPAIALVAVALFFLLSSPGQQPKDLPLDAAEIAVKGAPAVAKKKLPQVADVQQGPSPTEAPPQEIPIASMIMPVEPASPLTAEKPLLAIIMDDLGRDLASARTLLSIDLPVTFAVLPGEPLAARVATLAYREGREVLIHLPMEPRSYPVVDPGDDALLVEQSAEEMRRRFQTYLRQVPHATGANNHMGSRFTENSEGLAIIFAEMKKAGLFFVDSLTSPKSVALAGARQSGLRGVGRDLFLDNVQDTEHIAIEIRRLVALAEKRGQAVGICHPYPQTMEALRREAPFLRERVEMVVVSRLLSP